MKRVRNIEVRYEEESGNTTTDKYFREPNPVDDFLHWLVVEGFYDDISVTKKFNLTDEVIKRMKGKK